MISYKYKLYNNKRLKHLDNMKREACFVWNHALALQKRYYKLYGKYISATKMQKHFSKRIKRTYLHSQSLQEVLQRLDTAYNRFFKRTSKRPPRFKKHSDFHSFCYKQGGFTLCGNVLHINSVDKDYRFWLSRPWRGNIKNVRLKYSPKGEWYLYVVTDAISEPIAKSHNGASVGIDFGLKTYMTLSDGIIIDSPQYLKRSLSTLRGLSRSLSKKKKGSNHRNIAKRRLAAFHEHVANSRLDFHWKLAHALCREYDYIFIEDLNLNGMKKLWGRKVSDLAYGQFVGVLKQVAVKYRVIIHEIERYYPSSRLCECGYKNDSLSLSDRQWVCPRCGRIHDRDLNAAGNILRRGIYELGSDYKTFEAAADGLVASSTQESHVL